jgi:hypothetical protein
VIALILAGKPHPACASDADKCETSFSRAKSVHAGAFLCALSSPTLQKDECRIPKAQQWIVTTKAGTYSSRDVPVGMVGKAIFEIARGTSPVQLASTFQVWTPRFHGELRRPVPTQPRPIALAPSGASSNTLNDAASSSHSYPGEEDRVYLVLQVTHCAVDDIRRVTGSS